MSDIMEYVNAKRYLSSEEKEQMGNSMAQNTIDIRTIGEEAKGVASQYKAQIDKKKGEISLLATNITNGYIAASVYAEKKRNSKLKLWEWFDVNTGECIKTEEFTWSDHNARKRRNFVDKVWEWVDPETDEVLKTEPFTGNDFQLRVEDMTTPEIPAEPTEPKEILMLGSGEDLPAEDVEYQDVDNAPEPDNDGPESDQDDEEEEETDEDRELNDEVDQVFGIATETTDYPKNVNFPIVDNEGNPVEKRKAGRPRKQ